MTRTGLRSTKEAVERTEKEEGRKVPTARVWIALGIASVRGRRFPATDDWAVKPVIVGVEKLAS